MQYRKKFTVVILAITILVIGWITMDFKASENLPEQISDYLEEKIITFNIHPGERILETTYAEVLGCEDG